MTPKLVDFEGHGRFWFLQDDDGNGPLAPLEHCDAHGHVLAEHRFGVSYAHVYGPFIFRHDEIIGNSGTNLKEVTELTERDGI